MKRTAARYFNSILRYRRNSMYRVLLGIAVALALGVLHFAAVPIARAAVPPQPTYGSAVVDGNPAEWDLTNDFFAFMYEAGKDDKDKLSNLYLRYDCATGTLYALVLAINPARIQTSNADNFIKLGNNDKLVDGNDGNNGTPPDFQYISPSGGQALGWEASALLAPGSYTNLNVHALIFSGRTSAVKDRSIPLTITCTDLGDLPAAYGIVLVANNGGRHTIGNLYLGARIDGEADGFPSAQATGDDLNNPPDDEDGVIREPLYDWTLAGGGKVRVTVSAPGAGIIGCLSGWMDFNKDNDFNDPGEMIINNVGVSSGTTTFSFSIPAGTILPNEFFSRFRLYPAVSGSCGTVVPALTGLATNGEVEDHLLSSFGPTSVHLGFFKGVARDKDIKLKWRTGSELDVLGFNVYRSNTKKGTYEPLNDALIPAIKLGQLTGAKYVLRDVTAESGHKYFFKLELIDKSGATLEWSDVIKVRKPASQ